MELTACDLTKQFSSVTGSCGSNH